MDNPASAVTEAAEAGVAADDIVKQTVHGGKTIARRIYKRQGAEASRRSHEAWRTRLVSIRAKQRD